MEFENQYLQEQYPKYDCLLLDLDDTIYSFSSGISAHCAKNILDYMLEKLGIDESIVSELSTVLYKQYGTTMAGLRIFTNGDRAHASKVLNRMGLEDCFEGVICFETLNPNNDLSPNDDNSQIFDILKHISESNVSNSSIELPKSPILCKPNVDAMIKALKLANIDPKKTIFFDDSIRNIQAGKEIGLHTVLVGTSNRVKGADYALESIHNIKEALPELWDEAEKTKEIEYSNKVAIETSVTA